MARTLLMMAACVSLGGGMSAAAEPPPPSTAAPSESAELQIATVDLAAAPADSVVTDAPAPTEPATAADTEPEELQPVKEVTLDPTVKPPVCRRYVPTGSRIATEVCHSAEVADAVRAAERDQTRRDIDEMRMRQATRDQARAAAQTEALRRRAGF